MRTTLVRFAVALALPFHAAGSEAASPADLREGVALLEAGRYEDALAQFEAARGARPDDPQANFFAGAALNRLGRSGEALERLDRSLALSVLALQPAHPELEFERGWARLRERRYRQAVRSLRAYEAGHPGRGQTAEFLGRAYLGQGKLDAAEAQFELAVERDPRLEPTVRLARAALEDQRGQPERAQDELRALVRESSRGPLSTLLAERIPRGASARPWSLVVGAGAGYDTNAIAVSDDELVRPSVSDQSDRFARLLASGRYTWRPASWTLSAAYSLQGDFYDDISDANQLDQVLELAAVHNLPRSTAVGLRLRDNYTRVDADGYRNQVRLTPVFWWRPRDWVVAELSYALAQDTYLDSSPSPALDRDGTSSTIAPTLYVTLAEGVRARLGWASLRNDADGGDYDFDGSGVVAQLDVDLPLELSGRAYYSLSDHRYDEQSSLAPNTGRRSDDLQYLSLYLERTLGDLLPVSEKLRTYGQYDFIERDSNVSFYSFDQQVFSAGVVYEF